jgi:hypothetical protein
MGLSPTIPTLTNKQLISTLLNLSTNQTELRNEFRKFRDFMMGFLPPIT